MPNEVSVQSDSANLELHSSKPLTSAPLTHSLPPESLAADLSTTPANPSPSINHIPSHPNTTSTTNLASAKLDPKQQRKVSFMDQNNTEPVVISSGGLAPIVNQENLPPELTQPVQEVLQPLSPSVDLPGSM